MLTNGKPWYQILHNEMMNEATERSELHHICALTDSSRGGSFSYV